LVNNNEKSDARSKDRASLFFPPFEQPGFSDLEDRRAQTGDEKRADFMAEKSY